MRILIAAPVRQNETTFRLYLQSLKALDTTGHDVQWQFILHDSPHLEKFLSKDQFKCFRDDSQYVKNNVSHYWNDECLRSVTTMKNDLFYFCHYGGFDAIFLVDSDLLLHPKTLQQLVSVEKPIVSNVFWTRWQPGEPEMPNAWMADHYGFDSYDRIALWRRPGLYQVGMTGACTLIRREVIERGVNFSPIHNVSFTTWEDRAFCIRAACAGFPIYMDTTYPARHLYRDEDVQEVIRDGNPFFSQA